MSAANDTVANGTVANGSVGWVRYSAHLTEAGAYDAVDSYYAHGTLAEGELWRVGPFNRQRRNRLWVVEIGQPLTPKR